MFLSEIFLSEQQDAVAIIFGRFNPPHKGHRAAWETAAQYPHWYVGTNQSTQGPKDPLPYDIKIEAMKTIWPEVEDHIVAEQSWLTLASKVFDEHGEVTLVCCTDEEWVTKTIIQYNGQQGAHGYYNFPEIRQEPTPRLSSATALRDAVKAGDREAFSDAAGVSADTPVAGKPFFDLVAEYLLPYQNAPKRATKKKDTEVSEGWKSKAGAAALAAATVAGIGMSPKLTVDGVTYDKAISAPPEDAKTVTKDGKRYKVWQSSPLKQRPGGGKYNLYKQIDESAWPFDYLLETADTKSREFQWTDYDGMSMSDRMMVAETFFSKNSNLFETNEQHSVDYFFSLKPHAPALKEGTPYIAALLGMVNDRVVPLQAVEICTIVSKTGSEYKVRLSDGTITMFPNEYISKNMVAETFFFKDIDSYDQFRAAIFLKFSVDLVPQDQIKGIELLSDDISEEAAGVGVIASKKQAKDPRYSMSLTKDVRPGEVERSLKKLRLR